jgi:hypothetical protein
MKDKNIQEEMLLETLFLRLEKEGTPVRKEDIGNNKHSVTATLNVVEGVDLEFTYNIIPDQLNLTANFINLQSFVQISGTVSSEELQQDIRWMASKINPFLPMGNFGLFDRFDILYWKQNNYLDASSDVDNSASLIIAQTTFSQKVILDFHNSFMDVILKLKSSEESLKANKWASLMFP